MRRAIFLEKIGQLREIRSKFLRNAVCVLVSLRELNKVNYFT